MATLSYSLKDASWFIFWSNCHQFFWWYRRPANELLFHYPQSIINWYVILLYGLKYYRTLSYQSNDNTSYAGTKANYNACFFGANCSTIFQPPCLLRDFLWWIQVYLQNPVPHKTKHVAVAPFPMMLLNLLLCVVRIFSSTCLDNGLRQRMLKKVRFRQYRQAVLVAGSV
jgi:hypothetical protein